MTWVVMVTVPETLAPPPGAVIATTDEGVGVAVGVGVGVDEPLTTFTETAALPSFTLLLLKAEAEIVCEPFGTVVEFQVKVKGGDEAK